MQKQLGLEITNDRTISLFIMRLNDGRVKENLKKPIKFRTDTEILPSNSVYDIQRKISLLHRIIKRYRSEEVSLSVRFIIEPIDQKGLKIFYLVLFVSCIGNIPQNIVRDIKTVSRFYLKKDQLTKSTSYRDGGFHFNLSKSLPPKTRLQLGTILNVYQISHLIEFSNRIIGKKRRDLRPGDFSKGVIHLGQNQHGMDLFTEPARRIQLVGELDKILGYLVKTDFIHSNTIALVKSPIHLQGLMEDESFKKSLVVVSGVSFNILPIVLKDLNLGLRLFTIWARVLNRLISPSNIISFLSSIKSAIKNGEFDLTFNTFSDIIQSVEIRTQMALDQFNEFFDIFLPILTNPIFSSDNHDVLTKGGVVIVDTEKLQNQDVALLSTFLMLIKDAGYLNGELVIPHMDFINEKLSPYSFFDYYHEDSIVAHYGKTPKGNTPYDLLLHLDLASENIDLERDSSHAIIQLDSTVVSSAGDFNQPIFTLSTVQSIEDIFEQEVEQLEFESTGIQSLANTELRQMVIDEVNKWIILQSITPGDPSSYHEIFVNVGRYVPNLEELVNQLVSEERLLKRGDSYSVSSVSTQLLNNYKARMMEISSDYAKYITKSRSPPLIDLKFIKKNVSKLGSIEEIDQWIKNLHHFVEKLRLRNIFSVKCVAFVAAVHNIRSMNDRDLTLLTISNEVQSFVDDISEEIQSDVRDSMEGHSEDLLTQLEEAKNEELEGVSPEDDTFELIVPEEQIESNDEIVEVEVDSVPTQDDEEELVTVLEAKNREYDHDSIEITGDETSLEEEFILTEDIEREVLTDTDESNGECLTEELTENPNLVLYEAETSQTDDTVLHAEISNSGSLELVEEEETPHLAGGFTSAEIDDQQLGTEEREIVTELAAPLLENEQISPPPVPESGSSSKYDLKPIRSGIPLPSVRSTRSKLMSNLRPNEVVVPGSLQNAHPSGILRWSKIETEVFIVSEISFSESVKALESKDHIQPQDVEHILSYFKLPHFAEPSPDVGTSIDSKEIDEVDLLIDDDLITSLGKFFSENLNLHPIDVLTEALDSFFIRYLIGRPSGKTFEEIVLAISYTSGADGVHISTTDLTNELPLNIRMWEDADQGHKKQLVIRTLGEKIQNFLKKFRYNHKFVQELEKNLL